MAKKKIYQQNGGVMASAVYQPTHTHCPTVVDWCSRICFSNNLALLTFESPAGDLSKSSDKASCQQRWSNNVDLPTLPPTLLPVTERTIPVAPVPVLSEASAPACQPSLTNSDVLTSPEVNLDSVVTTQMKRYVHPTEKFPRLSKRPTRAQVINTTEILLAKNCPYSFIDVVLLDVIPFFEALLRKQYPLDKHSREECLQWRTWTTSRFCGERRKAVPDTAVARPNSASNFNELIAKLPVNFDLEDPAFEIASDKRLRAICVNYLDKTKEMELVATKLLFSRLPDQPINWQSILFRDIGTRKVTEIETISDFRFIWLAQLDCLRNKAQDMWDVGWTLTGNDNTNNKVLRKSHTPPSDDQPKPKKPATVDSVTCTGCGRANHLLETCRFKETRFFDATDQPYKQSTAYKLLRQQYPSP